MNMKEISGGTLNFYGFDKKYPFDISDIISLSEGYLEDNKDDIGIVNQIIESLENDGTLPFSYTPQEDEYLRNNSRNIWIKYLVYRFKFRNYPKRKIISTFPVYLLIEPVSSCNLRCVMCFQIDRTFNSKQYMGKMDFNLFKNVVDQAVEGGVQAVTLGSRGEPLLHNKIVEMLDYLSEKFIEIKIVTNATRLTTEISHAILRNKVNIITFSVDSEDKTIYEKIRVNGDFDRVLENIVNFNKICDSYPDVKIQRRISGVRLSGEQSKDKFYGFWKDKVDQVSMKNAFERWNTYENPVNINHNSPCYLIWERMYVWYDGTCNPCDSDYKSFLSYGNINENTIKQIWNGDAINRLRNDHLTNKRNRHVPCDRCGVS